MTADGAPFLGDEQGSALKEPVARAVVRMGVGVEHQIRAILFPDALQSLQPAADINERGNLIADEDGVGERETSLVLSLH